jgi:exodeoxyribonuclease-1
MSMKETFFFYDLETTSFSPREGRIVQFGGQRTDLELKPIGDPVNIIIKLTEDIVPDPEAVFVTGITPQQTVRDGVTEEEFLKTFNSSVNIPGTTFVGFNNIRFDDEFMRFTQYRNLYEPYVWQWDQGRSRWDLLDLVRMTRALRPEGIKWPVDETGKATNRLELIASLNKLRHSKAHDALSDVEATIDVARLIKAKQPKLFNFLYELRDKKKVSALVNKEKIFVYTSGKYPSEFEKTTVVQVIADHPNRQGALVYDLRHDPAEYKDMNPKQLAAAWKYSKKDKTQRLPVKTLLFNRCPAIAPLSVLDETNKKSIKISMEEIKKNLTSLKNMPDFPAKVIEALNILDVEREHEFAKKGDDFVDAKLYDGFFNDINSNAIHKIHEASPDQINELIVPLGDERLDQLLPLFIARNYPQVMNDEQRAEWEAYRKKFLLGGGQNSRLAKFFKRLEELSSSAPLSEKRKYMLEELQLWGESIMPEEDSL